MKKRIFSAFLIILSIFTTLAQNEKLYIYRNDKQFHFFNGNSVEATYTKTGDAYSTMQINDLCIPLTSIDSCVVRTNGIPDFYVNLIDYPELEELVQDWGKNFIYKANLRMDGNGIYDDLELQEVEFRGRGNTTWMQPKKPYRFKMKNKASVCGLPKAKSFALIANFIDPTHLRNASALWLANRLEMPFSNHAIPVNVYLNDKYRGLYMLTEKIGIGGGSVDIEEESGILFELSVEFDEDYQFLIAFKSALSDEYVNLPVMIKDPDLSELKEDPQEREEYLNLWRDDFTQMINAITHPNDFDISEYLDIDQAAKYLLIYSVMANIELQHPKSTYIYKEGLGTEHLYKFGPAWDFDWSLGYRGNSIELNKTDLPLFSQLTGSKFFLHLVKNPLFMSRYRQLWNDFYKNIYPEMISYIDNYAHLIEPDAKINGIKWPDMPERVVISSFEHATEVSKVKQWFIEHIEWCNNHPNLGLYN